MAGPPQPATIHTGQAFNLKPGASAQTADGTLRVGFDAVTQDSRCPKGVQCVWAGEAVVRIWLQAEGGERQGRELRSTPGPAQNAQAGKHTLRLVQVEPQPVSGRPIAPENYVLTLMLEATGSSAQER